MKLIKIPLILMAIVMPAVATANDVVADVDWAAIRGWTAIIFGIVGAVLGSLGYLQSRQTKLVANKIQADDLLDEAFDLLGGKEGTYAINRTVVPTKLVIEKGGRLIKKAKKLCPKYTRVYSIKAVYLRASGKFEDALGEIECAIKIAPEKAGLYNHKANLLDDLGLLNEAVDAYRESIQLKPDFALAYDNLGLLQKKLGLFKEAKANHEKAIELDGYFHRSYLHLANIYRILEQEEKAIEALNKSIELEESDVSPYFDKGMIYLKSEDYTRAIQEFEQCLSIDLSCARAYCGLAEVYLRKEADQEFYLYIERAFDNNPKLEWACNLIVKKMYQDKNDHELFEKLRENSERVLSYGAIYNSIANHFKDSQDFERELEFRIKAIDVEPKNEWLHRNLANLYRRIEKLDEAKQSIENSIAINDASHDIYSCLASIEYKLKNYLDAKRSFLKANSLKEDSHYLWGIGLCCEREDDFEEAVKYYEKALEVNPNHKNTLENLGMLYEYLGEEVKAQSISLSLKSLVE